MVKTSLNVAEKDVVKAILSYLEWKNIFAWRNNVGAVRAGKRFIRFGKIGSADILGILPDGRLLAIECKSTTGKLSAAQDFFLKQIVLNGGVAIVAHSLDEVIASSQNGWKSNI